MSVQANEELTEEEKHYWTPSAVYEFIKMYETHPELWNPMHVDHKDRNRRQMVIRQMADHFSVSSHEINRKIHILRSQIRSEIKKYYVMGESLDGSDDVYKGKWPFFYHLKFIIPLIAARKKFVSKCDLTFSMEASSSSLDIEENTLSFGEFSPSKIFKADGSVDFEDSNPLLDSDILEVSTSNGKVEDKKENSSKLKRLRDSILVEEKLSWSKSASLEMIQLYRSYPALWDSEDSLYKNKSMRHQLIQKIARHFKVGYEEINRKIHNIRSQMISEIKKHYVMGNSLDGSDDVYKGQWPFFHHMKFISPVIAARKKFSPANFANKRKIVSCDSGEITFNDENSLEYFEQHLQEEASVDEDITNSYEEIHLLPNNNIEIIETDKEASEQIDPIFVPLCQNKPRPIKIKKVEHSKFDTKNSPNFAEDDDSNDFKDDCQIFGNYVASELRGIRSEKQRKVLRRKILSAIMEVADMDDDAE